MGNWKSPIIRDHSIEILEVEGQLKSWRERKDMQREVGNKQSTTPGDAP
jgi:hypothetical protein